MKSSVTKPAAAVEQCQVKSRKVPYHFLSFLLGKPPVKIFILQKSKQIKILVNFRIGPGFSAFWQLTLSNVLPFTYLISSLNTNLLNDLCSAIKNPIENGLNQWFYTVLCNLLHNSWNLLPFNAQVLGHVCFEGAVNLCPQTPIACLVIIWHIAAVCSDSLSYAPVGSALWHAATHHVRIS